LLHTACRRKKWIVEILFGVFLTDGFLQREFLWLRFCFVTQGEAKVRVHLGLSLVEVETTTEKDDCCFEVFAVAIATHSSFDGHDLAVDSFRNRIGYSKRAV
jgi:hypothetical protein